jgi:hypothetical protein
MHDIINTSIHLRSLLEKNGIAVERRQGLTVYQSVAAAMYAGDNSILMIANQLISTWTHSRQSTTALGAAQNATSDISAVRHETESNWRQVDAVEKRFSEVHKYSGVFGESPSLSEAKRTYLKYCDQKEFPRTDRVKLISCILKVLRCIIGLHTTNTTHLSPNL